MRPGHHISLDDEGAIARSEDVTKRYEAYGWHTQRIDWTTGGTYKEDVAALYAALAEAKTARPSFVSLRTIIGSLSKRTRTTGWMRPRLFLILVHCCVSLFTVVVPQFVPKGYFR